MFNHATAIGIDTGTFFLKTPVVNSGAEDVSVKSYPLNKKQTKDYLILIVFYAATEIRKSTASEEINPICIGITIKGFIDQMSCIIMGHDHSAIDCTNFPFAKIVNKEPGLPVYIRNYANMMTTAEHKFGTAKGLQDIIIIALRTGIGGVIIFNGKLCRGANNDGGDIGQRIIDYDGSPGETGIRVSFEHHASAYANVRRYYEEIGNSYDRKSRILTCKEVFELRYANLPESFKMVKENAEMLASDWQN